MLVLPTNSLAYGQDNLGKFTQSIIQMNKYVLSGNTTMTVVLSQDSTNSKQINISAQDTTYNFVSMKWVKGQITTEEGAAVFDTDEATTIPITEGQEVTASFWIDSFDTYTVYAQNSNGDVFLAVIHTKGQDVPTITVTRDETNNLKTTIVAEDGEENVVSLKIVKKSTKDEEPDFDTYGEDISITPAQKVTVEYIFSEAGIYAIRATDTSGNYLTKTVYIYQDFPITADLSAVNKLVTIEANSVLSNIVSMKVVNSETKQETKLSITSGMTVNTTFNAPSYGEYTLYIVDEIGFTKEITFTLQEQEAPVATVTYSPTSKTNGYVKFEITFDEENVKLTGIVWNDEYGDLVDLIDGEFCFTKNGTCTFTYESESGVEGTGTATVDWISPVDIEKNYTIMEVESSKYIRKIDVNTTGNNFLENINVIDANYKIYDGLENSVDLSKGLATSQILRYTSDDSTTTQDYTLIVTGDINGDGKMSATDVSQLKLHLIEASLLTGDSFYAADMNYDNNLTLTDLSQLKAKLIE